MKKFVAVYLGSNQDENHRVWEAMDPAKRQELEQSGMQAWGDWMVRHQQQIVDTAPLGKTKRISKDGISDTSNAIAGFIILHAESHEEAAKLFENHPHFTIFPGECVEIMECLPLPGQ